MSKRRGGVGVGVCGGAEARTGDKKNAVICLQWNANQRLLPPGMVPTGLFASMGVAVPGSNPGDDGQQQQRQIGRMATAAPELGFGGRYLALASASASSSAEFGFKTMFPREEIEGLVEEKAAGKREKIVKRQRWGLKLRVGNASLKRLVSGAIAGAVSRTAVAPLETIRTHLMVGSSGDSMVEVFHHIMRHEGWQGLFRGNGVNVIRVAPSKAIELVDGGFGLGRMPKLMAWLWRNSSKVDNTPGGK